MKGFVGRLLVLSLQCSLWGLLLLNLESSYSYAKINFEPPRIGEVLLAFLALSFTAILLPAKLSSPSAATLWWLATFLVTSTLAVAIFNPAFSNATATSASVAVILGFAITAVMIRRNRPIRTFAYVNWITPSNYARGIFALTAVAIITVLVANPGGLNDFSLASSYDRRFASRAVPDIVPLSRYLRSYLSPVFIPLTLMLGLRNRKFSYLALAVFAAVAVFEFDGQKSPLIAPILVAVMLWAFAGESAPRNSTIFGVLLTSVFILVPIAISIFLPQLYLDVYISRRMGLVPAILTNDYVNFSQTFGYTRFSQSWLQYFPNQDRTSAGIRVGSFQAPGSGQNSNANLWADGFLSLGFLGVVIISLIFVFLLRFADRLAASRDFTWSCTALSVVFTAYSDGYLHTSFLSYGVVASLLLLWLHPKDKGVTGLPRDGQLDLSWDANADHVHKNRLLR